MKLKALWLTSALILSVGQTNAHEIKNTEHFVVHYESGDVYEIQLNHDTITWSGLKGTDLGRVETDSVKRKKLSAKIEVMQWTEISGSFVTLVLDRQNLKAVSSGKVGDETWLALGQIDYNVINGGKTK